MAESGDAPEQSLNSVQSPLKPRHNEVTKQVEASHTLGVEVADAAVKGDYELARDRRVAAIQELLKPVHQASTAL